MNNKKKIIIIISALSVIFGIIFYMLFFKKVEVTAISLDKNEISIVVGNSDRIIATIYPSNATDRRVKWVSSDPSIVTVNEYGIIEGIKKGEAEVRVATLDDKISNICTVKVLNNEIERIDLLESEIRLKVGESKEIKASIVPSNATLQGLKYLSSDDSIAIVDEKGVVTGKAVGKVEIKITDEEEKIETKCNVTVVIPVETIALETTTINMNIGDIKSIKSTITPTDATNQNVKWETSNSEIVAVNQNGQVKAQKIGTVKIKVISLDNGLEASCTINVNPYNSFGAYKHVFIIGVDGLGAALNKVSSPNFDRIFGDYAYRHDANTEIVTISAQNWGSILTGVPYNVHGYTNDSIANNKHTSKDKTLSIFYYVYKSIPNAKLLSVTHWDPINYGIIENDIGVKMNDYSSDDDVTNKVIEYINSGYDPTLLFLQLDDVDHTAHVSGGFSEAYYSAVRKADEQIGKIYDAIDKRGLMKDSLFVVVADHGETSNGHGGNSKEESSAIVAVRGHSVNKVILNANVRNRDVSSIALYGLGVNKPSHFQASVPSELFGEKR